MTATHLLQSARFPGRVETRPGPRAPSLLRRLLDRYTRRRRQALPLLSDHLCRDIGLEPPPRESPEYWLLFGRP